MDGIRIQQKKLLPWPAAPAGAEIFRKNGFYLLRLSLFSGIFLIA